MKKLLFFTLASIIVNQGFTQTITEINHKIDSLEKVKQNIVAEKRILEKKEERTENLLKIWKEKKNNYSTSSTTSKSLSVNNGIVAKVVATGGSLRERPMGNEVKSIPGGATIYVQNEFSNLYFKVVYQGTTGYLSYSSIEQNADVDMLLQKRLSNSSENTKPNSSSSDNSAYNNDPKYKRIVEIYGKEVSVRIMKKEIWKGMSPGMLLESQGNPQKTTEETTSTGKRQVWHYSDKYVYVEKGSVSEWKAK
ncbi:MAG: hypothetical protein JXR58_00840 [Bacteroidales bacterium]|nr:hypothetical protein [Bacteroidales bacterium]